MKPNLKIKLFIIVLVFSAIFYYSISKSRLYSGMEGKMERPFSFLDFKDIEKITIYDNKNKISIVRKGDDFFLSKSDLKVNKSLVYGFIKIVSDIKILRIASIKEEKKKDFGLTEKNSVKIFILTKNSKTARLRVGIFAPEKLSCYFDIPKNKNTFLTLSAIKYAASTKKDHWIDK